MTEIVAVTAAPSHLVSNDREPHLESSDSVLLEPLRAEFAGDPLSEFYRAMDLLAQATMESSKVRIEAVNSQVRQKLEEFLDKLAAACEAARKAREDDGGWFSDIADFVGDVLGEVLGAVADFSVDAVTGPIEIAIAVVENFGDTQAMLRAIGESAQKLVENGSTAEDVKGFTQGVVSFASDLAELSVRLHVALARSALTGEDFGTLAKGDLDRIWGSLRENILDNPHFWAVTGAIAKGAAIVGAAMSGGALLPVAVGLMVFLEADDRYGILKTALGDEAASWARFGVEVAAGLCLAAGAMGSSNGLLNAIRTGTGVAQGAGLAYAGYQAVVASDDEANRIEQQADLTATLHQLHRLQRLLDQLIASLQTDAKDHRTTRELGAGLFRTQAATAHAQIIPA